MKSRILKNKKALSIAFFQLSLLVATTTFAQHCTPAFHVDINDYTAEFHDQSVADGDITDYSWDFGDGQTSTEPQPIHTYTSEGTYNVCLTITAHNPGCTATYCHHVVIHSPPPGHCEASFSAHQPDPDEPVIVFIDESTSDGQIIYWSWNFANGPISVEQNPTVVFPGPGTYYVCLYIEDDAGCTSEFCHDVIIHHPPAGECHALFGAHQLDPADPVITFSDLSTSDGHIMSWLWEFGDGHISTEQNPTHTFELSGSYLVCLYITDDSGCTAHYCHEVVVHHAPPGICHASFAAHQSEQNELQVNFTDLSTADGSIVSWLWDFGDGTTSSLSDPSHIYAHTGTYLVCLFMADDNGCTSHFCHHVTIHHMPTDVDHSVYRAPLLDATINVRSVSSLGEETFISVNPNPAIHFTTINYELTIDAEVKLEIVDLTGQRVIQTVFTSEKKGLNTRNINAGGLQPGMYVVQLIVGEEVFFQKLMIAD